jgi:capsular exopolysaccharide synthesis family protein
MDSYADRGADPRGSQPEWLQAPAEEEGLARYLTTLRQRLWVLILIPLLTTAVAVAYVLTADKVYEAEATLLVTPVSQEDPALSSLGLIQESSDPLRAVETAATLVTTNEVAERVARELDTGETPSRLADKVVAEPLAESNLVAVTAQGATPEEAADLANAFAEGVVEQRTRELHKEIEELIPQVESQLQSGGQTEETLAALSSSLARLRTLSEQTSPDLRVETAAQPPGSPVSPQPVQSIAAGLIAGLILGLGAAFGLQAIDPKLRREEQLRRQYQLPILARVPREPRAPRKRPLHPSELSPATQEAYRTLRGNITMGRRNEGESRVILVTGSSPSEGKTTTAANLAVSLTLGGNSVIMIDADLRRPALGKALSVEPDKGVVGVLLGQLALEDALMPVTTYGSNLKLLAAEHEGGWIAELFSLPSASKMLAEARELADYVVIDSPPPTEVVDALPLARNVDEILLVVRLGVSRLDRIQRLAELIAENGLRPAGFAVVGVRQRRKGAYYYQETSRRRGLRRRSKTEEAGVGVTSATGLEA